jgi:hypothetical protein
MEAFQLSDGKITTRPLRSTPGFGIITSVTPFADFAGACHPSFRQTVIELKKAGTDFFMAAGTRCMEGQPMGIPIPVEEAPIARPI